MKFSSSGSNYRKKILFYITAGMAAVFLFNRYVIKGIGSQISLVTKQITIAENELGKLVILQSKKNELVEDIKLVIPYVKAVNFQDDGGTILLKEIEQMVHVSGGTILMLNLQNSTSNSDDYKKYLANIRLELSFSQLLMFLGKIQDSKILISLDRFSVAKKDETSGMLKVEGVVALTVPINYSKK